MFPLWRLAFVSTGCSVRKNRNGHTDHLSEPPADFIHVDRLGLVVNCED